MTPRAFFFITQLTDTVIGTRNLKDLTGCKSSRLKRMSLAKRWVSLGAVSSGV